MKTTHTKASVAAIAAALTLTAVAGMAAAFITDAHVESRTVADESLRGISIANSQIGDSSIMKGKIENAHLRGVSIEDATLRESYVQKASLERVLVENSRIEDATLRAATYDDATLCSVATAGGGYGECALVSGRGNNLEEHAWLHADAPEKVAPGGSYDLRASFEDAGTLTVTNDPAAINEVGFDLAAADASVANLSVWVDDEMICEFALGGSCDLQGNEEFTLRVNVAETGIIDQAVLGLVLDVGGHGLRAGMTSLDVMATQLAFAPVEAQPFAPFVADAVGRLVITLPTDDFGNVDRDIDVAVSVQVNGVDASSLEEGAHAPELGDTHDHASVHGDSELLSDEPFQYVRPTSEAAHHPATLEMILRDSVGLPGITHGAASFHATHLGAIGPYATNVTLTASAMNADGEMLTTEPWTFEMPPTAEESTTVNVFGTDFPIPGQGTLLVNLVDENGDAVEAQEGWILSITDSPESHNTTMEILIDGDSENQPLAASLLVPLPFGNFVPSAYLVCLHHDGQTDCVDDGELVTIETGKTTTVEIVVS